MNQNAFNLFTALVGFVMIMLVVILSNSMTQTEDRAISTLSDLESQSEIQAVADLARGDALQVFVYHLRSKMEVWLTREGNWFPIYRDKTWDEIVENYITANFGSAVLNPATGQYEARGQQFAFEASKYLSGILAVGGSFGRYTIDLEQDNTAMINALNQTITNSLLPGQPQDFFELIGCTKQTVSGVEVVECNPGTFYVNLDLSLGAFNSGCDPNNPSSTPSECEEDNTIYESLPKIIIKSSTTGDVLETAILPRSKLRIYIPLRIFKVVAGAKKIADERIYKDNPDFRGMVKNLRLGLCDSGCNVRQGDVFTPASGSWDYSCPFTAFSDASATVNISIPGLYNEEYTPGDEAGSPYSIRPRLKGIMTALLCDSGSSIRQEIDAGNPFVPNQVECEIKDLGVDITTRSIIIPSLPAQTPGTCFRPLDMKLQLKYLENDDKYKVNQNTTGAYTIQIVDSFENDLVPQTLNLGTCKVECDNPLAFPCNGIEGKCVP